MVAKETGECSADPTDPACHGPGSARFLGLSVPRRTLSSAQIRQGEFMEKSSWARGSTSKQRRGAPPRGPHGWLMEGPGGGRRAWE